MTRLSQAQLFILVLAGIATFAGLLLAYGVIVIKIVIALGCGTAILNVIWQVCGDLTR